MLQIDLSQYHVKFTEKFAKLLAQNRLPHGVLLNNINRLPLESLLLTLATILLNGAKYNDLATSPDVFYLKAEEGQIKLDQIKNLLEGIYLTSYGATAKVVVISPLEALNTSAANALLKSLEEPPKNTYFLMTSNYLHWVMPTLRSRVQIFDIMLNIDQKKNYLVQKYQMTKSEVAKALKISKEDLTIIDRIKEDKNFWQLRKELIQVLNGKLSPLDLSIDLNNYYQEALHWLIIFLIDTYYYKFNIKSALNHDQQTLTVKLVNRYDHIAIYTYYQRLLKLKTYQGKHFNVNKQLAIESFLIELFV